MTVPPRSLIERLPDDVLLTLHNSITQYARVDAGVPMVCAHSTRRLCFIHQNGSVPWAWGLQQRKHRILQPTKDHSLAFTIRHWQTDPHTLSTFARREMVTDHAAAQWGPRRAGQISQGPARGMVDIDTCCSSAISIQSDKFTCKLAKTSLGGSPLLCRRISHQ
ncbi:hypothetical protein AMAG_18997 [Allomyces macrogynus ATCC 38327]|uniref:Uncharacterized protein n=1 Tax=Allomyces macrogynus (strain ATCC 38327) TaxID=578462 RepID=A0A0L0SLU5_ALLM3|nr:hypothetical protein AMAG_18997 [Allomyces macrogynus ATCC 38327]|eukprot:KNE63374.1 hypothetical protein AMAG_18997 [Allomyces macrogynus ATCC 38327]